MGTLSLSLIQYLHHITYTLKQTMARKKPNRPTAFSRYDADGNLLKPLTKVEKLKKIKEREKARKEAYIPTGNSVGRKPKMDADGNRISTAHVPTGRPVGRPPKLDEDGNRVSKRYPNGTTPEWFKLKMKTEKNTWERKKLYKKARAEAYVPTGNPKGRQPKRDEDGNRIPAYIPTGRPRGRPKKRKRR